MWNPIVVVTAVFFVATAAQAAPRSPDPIEPDVVTSSDQAAAASPSSQAPDHSQHQDEPQATPVPVQGHGAMAGMAQKHAGMMATMAADHAKLEALMKQMAVATGAAKVDAMAQVIGELVRQRHAMHDQMSKMDHAMCATMMQHK